MFQSLLVYPTREAWFRAFVIASPDEITYFTTFFEKIDTILRVPLTQSGVFFYTNDKTKVFLVSDMRNFIMQYMRAFHGWKAVSALKRQAT